MHDVLVMDNYTKQTKSTSCKNIFINISSISPTAVVVLLLLKHIKFLKYNIIYISYNNNM